MSNFFQNKQNLILVGQIVVIAGITYIIFKKIKNVEKDVHSLHKMVLTQQEQINVQNKIIESLINNKELQQENYKKINKKMSQNLNEKYEKIKTPPESPKVLPRKRETLDKASELFKNFSNPLTDQLLNSALIFNMNPEIPMRESSVNIEVLDDDEDYEINTNEEKKEEEVTEEDLDKELEDELNELKD